MTEPASGQLAYLYQRIDTIRGAALDISDLVENHPNKHKVIAGLAAARDSPHGRYLDEGVPLMSKPKPPKTVGVGICITCGASKSLLKGHICPDCLEKMGARSTGVSGTYPGGTIWAVRWAEQADQKPHIHQASDEDQARSLYDHVATAHINRELSLKGVPEPELLAARIHWVVQKE